jgi:hypothetical protein
MPVLKGRLQNLGALVDVLLGWSDARARQLRASLRPVPPAPSALDLLASRR